MKTAEEILSSIEIEQLTGIDDSRTLFEYDEVVKAMNLYANAKLDEAKLAVSLLETNVYTTPDTDTGFSQGIDAAMESILSLKDKV